jgi:hypothetical protein
MDLISTQNERRRQEAGHSCSAVGAVLHGTLEIVYKFVTALWLHNTLCTYD